MKSIEVMRQENKYILKMVEKLQELSMDAHEMRRIKQAEFDNCIEFIQLYVIEYHQAKQEHILFEEARRIKGREIDSFIDEILQIQGIGNTYFNQFKDAYCQYKEGKFLAIYNIINNAYTYGVIIQKGMKKEEDFYEYINHTLTPMQKNQIDYKIAYFHKQVEGEQMSSLLS